MGIDNSPLFHHALDEAYKYRLILETANSIFEYYFRYFDVDVDFVKRTKSIDSIGYYKCEITNYSANTLESTDFESYFKSSSSFAIVDKVEFDCRGVNSNENRNMNSYYNNYTDDTVYMMKCLKQQHMQKLQTSTILEIRMIGSWIQNK